MTKMQTADVIEDLVDQNEAAMIAFEEHPTLGRRVVLVFINKATRVQRKFDWPSKYGLWVKGGEA